MQICSTKALPDLLPTASILAPFLESQHAQDTVDLEDGPCVVLIQNGIGIEHPLASAYPSVPIISVVAWIGANLKPGGRVTHGMLEKLIMGLYTGEGSEPVEGEQVEDAFGDPHGYRKQPDGPQRLEEGKRRLKVFADLINNGGGTAVVVDDIQPKRYEKNLWNAALSSLCTLSRCTVSQAVDPAVLPYTLPVVRRTMLEVMYVARAWGYKEDVLPLRCVDEGKFSSCTPPPALADFRCSRPAAIKITINNYQRPSQHSDPNTPFSPTRSADPSYGFPTEGDLAKESFESSYNFKPSMLLDAEAGRPMELEPIIGSLLDRARAKSVPTPRLDMAFSALKIQQDQAIRAYSSSATYQEHIKNWLSRPPAVAGLGAAGRKAWERAVKKAELPEHEQGSVEMAGWRDKSAYPATPIETVNADLLASTVPGKPVRADSADI